MGTRSLPAGLKSVFGCVRPVIFQNRAYGYPAVTGTGFLLGFVGQVFFVTARHVLANYDADEQPPAVQYNLDKADLLPLHRKFSYRSVDLDDTDHVDVAVFAVDESELDRKKFETQGPFELGPNNVLRKYSRGDVLHFEGCPSDTTILDYDNQKYDLHFASADLIYQQPSDCRNVHIGCAQLSDDCPDFDGLSGSPVFRISDKNSASSAALFAGMLIQATRSSKQMRFLSGESIASYIYGTFVEGMTPAEAAAYMKPLFVKTYGS